MKRYIEVWSKVMLLLSVVSLLCGVFAYSSEAGRFYAVVYDASGNRDTVVVVSNVSRSTTSYTIEIYDAFGELLAAETITSEDPYASEFYSLASMIYEADEDADWQYAWGLCIVRPLVYGPSGDLFALAVETYVGEDLVDVYQVTPSSYGTEGTDL
jgi:hypothetical protein